MKTRFNLSKSTAASSVAATLAAKAAAKAKNLAAGRAKANALSYAVIVYDADAPTGWRVHDSNIRKAKAVKMAEGMQAVMAKSFQHPETGIYAMAVPNETAAEHETAPMPAPAEDVACVPSKPSQTEGMFQRHYGYEKASVRKWEYSDTFAKWGAFVTFEDGHQCYTWPKPAGALVDPDLSPEDHALIEKGWKKIKESIPTPSPAEPVKVAHTPLPYSFGESSDEVIAANGEPIAACPDGADYDQWLVNGPFIVTACNSHAAYLAKIQALEALLLDCVRDMTANHIVDNILFKEKNPTRPDLPEPASLVAARAALSIHSVG